MRSGRSGVRNGARRAGAGALLALGLGMILGVGWAGALVPAPQAGAQQSLIDSDPAVVKARADLEAAQAAAHEAADKVEATTEQRDAVVGKIADDQAHIAAL